jgi:hypothetical protein
MPTGLKPPRAPQSLTLRRQLYSRAVTRGVDGREGYALPWSGAAAHPRRPSPCHDDLLNSALVDVQSDRTPLGPAVQAPRRTYLPVSMFPTAL